MKEEDVAAYMAARLTAIELAVASIIYASPDREKIHAQWDLWGEGLDAWALAQSVPDESIAFLARARTELRRLARDGPALAPKPRAK